MDHEQSDLVTDVMESLSVILDAAGLDAWRALAARVTVEYLSRRHFADGTDLAVLERDLHDAGVAYARAACSASLAAHGIAPPETKEELRELLQRLRSDKSPASDAL